MERVRWNTTWLQHNFRHNEHRHHAKYASSKSKLRSTCFMLIFEANILSGRWVALALWSCDLRDSEVRCGLSPGESLLYGNQQDSNDLIAAVWRRFCSVATVLNLHKGLELPWPWPAQRQPGREAPPMVQGLHRVRWNAFLTWYRQCVSRLVPAVWYRQSWLIMLQPDTLTAFK